jgi:GxxExxY protein
LKQRLASGNRPLLHRELSEGVLRAFYQVHYELGHGFPKSVYSAALATMLMELDFGVQREYPIGVFFHGIVVGSFRADMVVDSKIIVELKAGLQLERFAEAQTLNYLRSTEMEVALLLHFGVRPSFKRLIYTNDRKILRASSVSSVTILDPA